MARTDRGPAASSTNSSGGGSGAHTLFVVLLVALVVGALIMVLVPQLRHRVMKAVRSQVGAARANFKDLRSQPGKALRLFGGAVATQLLFAMVLGASLHAYGASASLAQLMVINTLAGILSTTAPTPGGMGVMEGGLIAGMTAAGIPTSAAIPAVIISRMSTCYLPPIWGIPALLWLRKHEYV
jgi:glycosyltransferase 2 family protein